MSKMRRVRTYKFITRILVIASLGLFALNHTVQMAYAAKYYPGGQMRCIGDSGHGNIHSVANYACREAASSPVNACASWLGNPNDSHSTVIVGSASAGTVPAKLWGMCTDKENRSSMMNIVAPDNSQDAFSCGGSCNFTRSGTWGQPTSNDVKIDVAKFIQKAVPVVYNGQPAYYMRVRIDRMHGGNESMGLDYSDIYLVLSDVPEIPPPPVLDLCMSDPWDPSKYKDSVAESSDTYTDIKIQNFEDRFKNLPYGKWNDTKIYAMPTDRVAWNNCYYAGTPVSANQTVSNVNDDKDKWMGHVLYPSDIEDSTTCLSAESLNNEREALKNIKPWENKLTLSGDAQVIWEKDTIVGGSYNTETKLYKQYHNGRQTVLTDAGLTFTEKAETGKPTKIRIECKSPSKDISGTCSCSRYPGCTEKCTICTNKYTPETKWCKAQVSYKSVVDEVSVDIPYNFENHPGVMVSPMGVNENNLEKITEVFSGETQVRIDDLWVSVVPRWNEVTVASYATEVPKSEVKLYAYIASNTNGNEEDSSNGDGCSFVRDRADKGDSFQCIELWGHEFGETDGLNSGGSLEGTTNNKDNLFGSAGLADWYRAYDAAAGDYMCFVAAVWPATSGIYTQMGTDGDNLYRYSTPACLIIAKRPTFQVWGDMFSNPGISADVGTKYNVYNAYYDDIENKYRRFAGPEVYLGSWAENGLILNGTTTTFATGAATAKNSGLSTRSGSDKRAFCERSPITIANKNCSMLGAGGAGIPAGMTNLDETVDYWLNIDDGSEVTVPGNANGVVLGEGSGWRNVPSATGKSISYLYATGDVGINASEVDKNTTYLVKAGGTVTIYGDIRYQDTEGYYSSLGEVPKVVIYGASRIDVRCNVSDVHAILVTPGLFNSCSNYTRLVPDNASAEEIEAIMDVYPYFVDEARESVRSQDRLKVFGAVVSNSVNLPRIYGAAAWDPRKYPENTYSKFKRDYMPTSDGLAAEIFDYDSSVMLWGEYMSSSAESDTLQIMYQSELAPRY